VYNSTTYLQKSDGGFRMIKTNKLILVLMLVLMTAFLGGCSTSEKIGVVDVTKVMADSPKVKKFQEDFNVKGKETIEQLEKEKATLSPEEFQKRQQVVYGEFMKVKQDMETQVQDVVKQTVGEISKEKKITVVLYKEGVAQGGTDITDDVIKKLQ
jgi:outer membrane protein